MKKILCFVSLFFWSIASVQAAEISGKIVQIKINDGFAVLVLENGQGKSEVSVDKSVAVEGIIPAEKVKNGYKIYGEAPGPSSGTRRSGSPFKGIPKAMRKSMGLPDIPETPEIPAAKPALPQIPKVPKVPKMNMKQGAETASAPAPADAETPAKSGRKVEHPEAEVPKEVGNVFGKADQEVLEAPSAAEEPPAVSEENPSPLKMVTSVEKTPAGLKLKVKNQQGEIEELTVSADSKLIRRYSVNDLSKNMNIKVEANEQKGKLSARKISVLS